MVKKKNKWCLAQDSCGGISEGRHPQLSFVHFVSSGEEQGA